MNQFTYDFVLYSSAALLFAGMVALFFSPEFKEFKRDLWDERFKEGFGGRIPSPAEFNEFNNQE